MDDATTNTRYVIRSGGGYVVTPTFRVQRVEITRPKDRLGPFVVVEGTGRYRRDMLRVSAAGENAVDQFGRPNARAYQNVAWSAAGVKAKVRRVRPEEQAVLDAIDAEIEDLREQLAQARTRRKEATGDAWRKAHVVRLAEVEAVLAEEPQR